MVVSGGRARKAKEMSSIPMMDTSSGILPGRFERTHCPHGDEVAAAKDDRRNVRR